MRVDELLTQVPHLQELALARELAPAPVWLVGGTVRDLLLGRTPADVDLATPAPEPLARRFAEVTAGHLVPMDRARGIWRVALDDGRFLDFCALRDTDILGDLHGRDFTFNAIAVRLADAGETDELVDPFQGMMDLQAGVLRVVSPTAFQDDPARILRAFRFVAELGLIIEEETKCLLRRDAPRLPESAVERLLAEWWKLCGGRHAADAIAQMDDFGALTLFLPEIAGAKGVIQNAYHHLDVWEHSLLAMTYLVRHLHDPEPIFQDLLAEFTPLLDSPHRRARLVFLALIHDIGKPDTRTEQDGKVHFYGHEQAGAELVEGLARRLRMSGEDTCAMTTIVRNHLRPLRLMQEMRQGRLNPRGMLRYFDATGRYALDVMALAMADKRAGRGPASDPQVLDHLRELYRLLFTFRRARYLPAVKRPFLTGRDLLALQLPPGPEVGHLLEKAREMQILGKLTSHEEALAWAARQAKSV